MNHAPIRILWQSSTVVEEFPAYRAAIEAHARERLFPGSTLEVRGVATGTVNLRFKAFDFLNNRALLEGVLAAEEDGFDAVALGCFLDPVLDELKEVIDIPLLSLGECGMHIAAMLGRRFALLSHTASLNTKFHRDLLHKYGLAQHAGPLVAFDMPFVELEAGLAGDAEACLGRIRAAGREAIAQGADVILLACGLMNLVAIRNGLTEIDGVPVLDVSGALMKLTEAMVVLRRTSGMRIGRTGFFERPDRAEIDRVLGVYGVRSARRGTEQGRRS